MESFLNVKEVLLVRDVSMDRNYETLSPGQEKDALDSVYFEMTKLLNIIEVNIYKILGVENEWFSQQIYVVTDLKTTLKLQPE